MNSTNVSAVMSDCGESTHRPWRFARSPHLRRWCAVALVMFVCLAACAQPTSQKTVHQAIRCPNSISSVPNQVTILAQRDGLYAPVDAAWSPQGGCVALVGEHRAHMDSPSDGPEVAIYDATTGTRVNSLQLTVPILATVMPRTAGIQYTVQATHVLWSPDGQRLAVSFIVSTTGYKPAVRGLVVTDVTGTVLSVLFETVSDATPPTIEWDLMTGSPASMTVQPALGYHWGASGQLLADAPLDSTTAANVPPIGPIGNPDGGSAFTIWQPGLASISPTSSGSSAGAAQAGIYGWSSKFDAWSPDGRYVVDGIAVSDGVTLSPATRFPGQRVPLLAVRDNALRAIYGMMPLPLSVPSGLDTQQVAWRPDGRVLAARLSLIGTQDGLDHHIRLYDATTIRRYHGQADNRRAPVRLGWRCGWSPLSGTLVA